MSGFTLDLPNTETIKKEVAAELAPTKDEKQVITDAVKEKSEQIMDVNLDSLQSGRKLSR